jgi:hypothetical protein
MPHFRSLFATIICQLWNFCSAMAQTSTAPMKKVGHRWWKLLFGVTSRWWIFCSRANPETRDRNGLTASDFAEESERNGWERHQQWIQYTEDPNVKKQNRRIIRCLLGAQPKPPDSTSISLGESTIHISTNRAKQDSLRS